MEPEIPDKEHNHFETQADDPEEKTDAESQDDEDREENAAEEEREHAEEQSDGIQGPDLNEIQHFTSEIKQSNTRHSW